MEATVIDYEEAKFAHEYKSVASDGYLGAIETTGSKYAEKRLYGTDLSKAIRDDLRKHLAVTKKSNVNVRIETGPMHQHVDVTIKLERDKFAKNWKDAFVDFMASDRRMPVWIRQSDEEGNNLGDVFNEEYYGMTGKEQEIVRERLFNHLSKCMEFGADVEVHHLEPCFLKDEARKIIEDTNTVLDAYNHDGSNSQVDYFDRHFYQTVYIRWI